MGKATLLVLAAFTVSTTLYNGNSQQTRLRSSERVSNHQYEALARGAALNGLNLAKQSLAESFTSADMDGSFDHAHYAVDIAVSGNRARVTSSGAISNASDDDQTYTVAAEFIAQSGSLPSAPRFMRYALVSDMSLNLGGSITTEVFVRGEEGREMNANMHTNGSLHIDGNKVFVEGYGTYMDNASSNPAKSLQRAFQPNYVSKEGDTAYRVDVPVEIPEFDGFAWVSQLEANGVEVVEIPGDFILDGAHDFGDRESPTVYYVLGNVYGSGLATINGYGMIAVDGNIVLTGDVEIGDSGYTGPDESSFAMYASGDIEVLGNVDVSAQIYAAGDVTLDGNPTIYGSVATLGSANLLGNPKIFYRSPSPGLSQNWQQREQSLRLNGYNER